MQRQSSWSFFKKPFSLLKDCALYFASLEALTFFTGNPFYSGVLLIAYHLPAVNGDRITPFLWKGTVDHVAFYFKKTGKYLLNAVHHKILEFTVYGQKESEYFALKNNQDDVYMNGSASLKHLQFYDESSIATPMGEAHVAISHFWSFDFNFIMRSRENISMKEIPFSSCQFEIENELVRINYNFTSRVDLCAEFQRTLENFVDQQTQMPSSWSLGWQICFGIASFALGAIIVYCLCAEGKEPPTILDHVGELESEIQKNIAQYKKLNAPDANKYEHAFDRLKAQHINFLLACNIAEDKQECPIMLNQFIDDPVHTVLEEKKGREDTLSRHIYERTALYKFVRRSGKALDKDMIEKVPIRQTSSKSYLDLPMPLTKAVTISNPVRVRVGDEKNAFIAENIFSQDALKVGGTHPLGKGKVMGVEEVGEPIYLKDELAKFIPRYVKQLQLLKNMIQEVLQKAIAASQRMASPVVIDSASSTVRRRR